MSHVFSPIALANNFQSFGGEYAVPTIAFDDKNGTVFLSGLIKRSTAPAIFTKIGSLGSDNRVRPNKRLIFTIASGNGQTAIDGRIDILPNGDIVYVYGSEVYLSLDGISFAVPIPVPVQTPSA